MRERSNAILVRHRRPRRGNALVLVTAILVLLAIIGTAYIVRTQANREMASAQQARGVIDDRIEVIAGTIADQINGALFVNPIQASDPGLTQQVAGVIPVARSDWPRGRPDSNASRYGIDPIDKLSNLLDPGSLLTTYAYTTGGAGDGYPDGYNFAPYSVRPYTNWPDNYGAMFGESNPLGNPGFGDMKWLASFEPQRATNLGTAQAPNYVPDPFGTTFSHWAHLSSLATAENGWRLVADISDITGNTLTGPQGTPATVPANPTTVPTGTSLAALGTPYEQWLPNVIPAPLTNAADFITRRNNWFTPAGYYNAVHGPFGQAPAPIAAQMLPNLIKLNDPFNTGTINQPGTRPTDEGPTRFLPNGTPNDTQNTIRNIVGRTLVDTDGDGITDSFWWLAPSSVDRSVRQIVGVRIIDNCAMLNVNVATRFGRMNTFGHTPSDAALTTDMDGNAVDTAVGFFNTPENSQPTGFFPSTPGLTVAYNTARWADTAENNPSFLRERGVIGGVSNGPNASPFFPNQLKTQAERIRLFKSAQGDGEFHFYNAPTGSGVTQPDATQGALGRLMPFTSADELELRMNNGQNQPFILSRFERSMNTEDPTYAFLRSTFGREEASEYTGKQLTLPQQVVDNRHRLTMFSAARNDVLPPALWTRWWNVERSTGQLRPVNFDDDQTWYGPPALNDLQAAYPTLAKLQADLLAGSPPAIPSVPTTQVFTTGGWRPECIRAVAGDANNDGVFDARDLEAARRDFFAWNAKLDLRAPLDVDVVGGLTAGGTAYPDIDPIYGILGRINGGVLDRGPDGLVNEFDEAQLTKDWTNAFRRIALRSMKSVYKADPDNNPTTAPIRTVSSYADAFQLGADMPATGFRTLTGTLRPRSIVGDGTAGKQVDTALKSELVTNAMVASLAANAACARQGKQNIGQLQANPPAFRTKQPLLPAHASSVNEGTVPDQRVISVDPDPTLPSNTPPGAKQIAFTGVDAHPVIMEAFYAIVWPKTRLGSEWQFKVGTQNPSVIAPKPADPFSVPSNYNNGGNQSHFVAIVPKNMFVDQAYDWPAQAPNDWQRQSTAVVAVQVANPFPHPIRLADFEVNVFGNTYHFPDYETDDTGNTLSDSTGKRIPLVLGPCLENEPRTAIVFAITDHNQINYLPGDSVGAPKRYPLTKGVEFDPFFRTRWLDYLDIVEAEDLRGANAGLQAAGLAAAGASDFCPHPSGLIGTENTQVQLSQLYPRQRLRGSSRKSSDLFGANLANGTPIAQSKILDATQSLGTDVASYRPDQGISVKRRLYDPLTGNYLSSIVVDRFDTNSADTNQTSADPVSGWNISLAAAALVDPAGRFWPPKINANLSADEDPMHPMLNTQPAAPPAPQPPHPWHMKPQQSTAFNGIRINTNDYYVTWTRSSRLWAKDFAVVYGANGDPVGYDRRVPNGHGKGDGAITPDERAPRYAFASAKQRPDLPLDGNVSSGPQFADGQGPFPGRVSAEKYRGAAFQAFSGLSPWVQDLTQNYGGNAKPYPLPPFLKNPANKDTHSQGCGDPDIVGAMVGGFPLKGNHLLPFVRNMTISLMPVATGNANALTTDTVRVAMKPTNFPTKTIVGVPQGETEARQIFGLAYHTPTSTHDTEFLGDKGMRPPVSDTNLDTEITVLTNGGRDFAAALDRLLPMDGAFTFGNKDGDFDTVGEVADLMVWGPVYDNSGAVKHTLSEILTDRVPGYPVGLVHRYVDLDGDGFSSDTEQNPAWPYLNRLHTSNPMLAFSYVPLTGTPPNPPSQAFLRQWGGGSAEVAGYASSLPWTTRLYDGFTLDDRGTTRANGTVKSLPYAEMYQAFRLSTDPPQMPANWTPTANQTSQWLEDHRFRLAAGFSGKGTPGLININSAPPEVIRAMPFMDKLVYDGIVDLDGDNINDVMDIDSNGDEIADTVRKPVLPNGNPKVRVAQAIDLYRSNTKNKWIPHIVNPDYPVVGNTQTEPNYGDRGVIPGDSNNDTFQDTGFYPGMRGDRGMESIGELSLLTRVTTVNGGGIGAGAANWATNHGWSIRFAGLDPFRLSQTDAGNTKNNGGGYRQSQANGPYQQPPYNARISTDSLRPDRLAYSGSPNSVTVRDVPGLNNVAGDAREQDLLLAGISNIVTTRSDVFTVYFRVRSVKQNPTTLKWDGTDPEMVLDDSRYIMCIDRSQVERPGDAPKVLYFQKLPH